MKILSIIGSSRKNGNTATLANHIAKNYKNHETLYLSDYTINNCTGCEGCNGTFQCIIKDDFNLIVSKMLDSDIIIWGSPTYWYNVSGYMKTFIDRSYSLIKYTNDSRTNWRGIFHGKNIIGIPLAVCEQETEDMMGFTYRTLELVMNDLGFKVKKGI